MLIKLSKFDDLTILVIIKMRRNGGSYMDRTGILVQPSWREQFVSI